jgi:hypothetical protein
MRRKILLLIIFTVILPLMLQAWDPASHIYLSLRMKEIWQEFDPKFYEALIQPNYDEFPGDDDRFRKFWLTKKFYYIGTTLPDMFDSITQEAAIQTLIDKLHEVRDDYGWAADLNYGLYIEDVTHNNIQTLIDFKESEPNQNIQKIREMAKYARDRSDWEPYEKALIYGCYAHLLQDIVAHQILQPATYGYGKSIDSPELLYDEYNKEIDILFAGELYQELFTSTHIDDWLFTIYHIFTGEVDLGYIGSYINRTYLEFYHYEIEGDPPPIPYSWQQGNFEPIQRFVEAAYASSVGYDVDNLTPDRMRSYMHGWAVILYFIIGTRLNPTSEIGGIFGHPEWTPLDVHNFILGIFDDAVSSSFLFHILDLWGGFWDSMIDFSIHSKIYGFWFIEALIPEYFDIDDPTYPWPYYLESTEGWNSLWADEGEKPDIINKIGSAIDYYERFSTEKKPNLRSTYADQLEEGLNFTGFIKDMIDNNYSVEGWDISRKAGLLGGMYDVDNSREYYLQPGIFDMHFESGGNPIYYIENELPSTIELKYKIIPFGNTKISINGKKVDGSWDRLVEEEITQAYTYINSSLALNVQNAVNNGYIELFFEVRTKAKDGSSNYQTMFLSDYKEAFDSDIYISDNQLYKRYFTEHGIPRRASGQDPIANPTSYWPYSISLVLDNLVLQNITVGTGQMKTYIAANSIQTAGDNTYFVIEGNGSSGGNVTMKAGSCIFVKPGFEARSGCTFASSIVPSLVEAYSTSTITSLTRNATLYDMPKSENDSAKISAETALEETKELIPTVFSCSQNSPNPFNINTTIRYGLPNDSDVSLCIYNLAGQKVRILVDANESAGYKSVSWDGSSSSGKEVPQGIYFYKFRAGDDFEKTYKMVVVK